MAGTARKVISAKYTGVGDTYVPIEQLLSTICDAQKCDTHMGDANMW